MKRLVLLRIAAHRLDTRTCGEKGRDGRRRPECRREMEGRPSITGKRFGERGLHFEERSQPCLVANGRGFKDVESNAIGCQAAEQKVADQILAAVDGPDQRGNSLRVARVGKRGSAWTAAATSAVAPVWINFRNGALMEGGYLDFLLICVRRPY
jgi:hypothetical protein